VNDSMRLPNARRTIDKAFACAKANLSVPLISVARNRHGSLAFDSASYRACREGQHRPSDRLNWP